VQSRRRDRVSSSKNPFGPAVLDVHIFEQGVRAEGKFFQVVFFISGPVAFRNILLVPPKVPDEQRGLVDFDRDYAEFARRTVGIDIGDPMAFGE